MQKRFLKILIALCLFKTITINAMNIVENKNIAASNETDLNLPSNIKAAMIYKKAIENVEFNDAQTNTLRKLTKEEKNKALYAIFSQLFYKYLNDCPDSVCISKIFGTHETEEKYKEQTRQLCENLNKYLNNKDIQKQKIEEKEFRECKEEILNYLINIEKNNAEAEKISKIEWPDVCDIRETNVAVVPHELSKNLKAAILCKEAIESGETNNQLADIFKNLPEEEKNEAIQKAKNCSIESIFKQMFNNGLDTYQYPECVYLNRIFGDSDEEINGVFLPKHKDLEEQFRKNLNKCLENNQNQEIKEDQFKDCKEKVIAYYMQTEKDMQTANRIAEIKLEDILNIGKVNVKFVDLKLN